MYIFFFSSIIFSFLKKIPTIFLYFNLLAFFFVDFALNNHYSKFQNRIWRVEYNIWYVNMRFQGSWFYAYHICEKIFSTMRKLSTITPLLPLHHCTSRYFFLSRSLSSPLLTLSLFSLACMRKLSSIAPLLPSSLPHFSPHFSLLLSHSPSFLLSFFSLVCTIKSFFWKK